jgi:carboxypeptidase C (cathepsin A)
MSTDIVLELSRIGRELDDLSRKIEHLDHAAVAWSEHRKAYATAYVNGTGSIKDREQAAVLAVEEQRLEAEVADQMTRAAKERIRVLRDRLEIGRSLNAARRAEFVAEPVGQPA